MSTSPHDDHPSDLEELHDQLQESRKGWDFGHWQAAQEDRQADEDLAYAEQLEINAEIAEIRHLYHKDMGDHLCKELGLDATEANIAECYRLAAEEGIGDRQCQIGDRYRDGDGIRQSHEDAAHWYARAANQGSLRAMREMVVICESGRGVPINPVEAETYRRLAEVVEQVV